MPAGQAEAAGYFVVLLWVRLLWLRNLGPLAHFLSVAVIDNINNLSVSFWPR